MSGQTHVLLQEFNGLARVLSTKASIGPAFILGQTPPPLQTFRAIWDTGADGTVITQNVVAALGLQPIGVTRVHTAGGVRDSSRYRICLQLQGGAGFTPLNVTDGILGGFDVLIGMDVISQGDFLITNREGKTVLVFQSPSHGGDRLVKNHADLLIRRERERAAAALAAIPKKPFDGTAKNAPCPCGSNKKYKLCCGA